MQKSDGMNYAPESQGVLNTVCQPGEFGFSVIGLDHGHIFAMCNGLLEAGATLRQVYDSDGEKLQAFLLRYPQGSIASSIQEILNDSSCRLVVSAVKPCDRFGLGLKVMASGKDYFVDKPGMLELEQVNEAREVCSRTGRKYMIYFGERIHVEGAVRTGQLIAQGAIGRVLHVTIMAPHRLSKASRPAWFFQQGVNGGIIADLGSHQVEQFLSYTGAKTARVAHSTLANYANHEIPGFYDYGDASLIADNGATCFFRVDWFTPAGLGAWGDGRVFIIGTEGTIEIRKYLDVARSNMGDQIYLVDSSGEHHFEVAGKIGFPFFGEFILDCLNRTEFALAQEQAFEAMRLAITAQQQAEIVAIEV